MVELHSVMWLDLLYPAGMATLPKQANLEDEGYQDLVCVLGMSSFILVSTSIGKVVLNSIMS